MPSFEDILKSLTAQPQTRPLDPNGVDVPGELPYMRRAYAQTGDGRNFHGTAEAGYSIFGHGNHTPVTLGSESHLSIAAPKGATAIVHTHPATGDPRASNGDTASAISSRLPNYIYSQKDGKQVLNGVDAKGKPFSYDVDKWGLNRPSVPVAPAPAVTAAAVAPPASLESMGTRLMRQ